MIGTSRQLIDSPLDFPGPCRVVDPIPGPVGGELAVSNTVGAAHDFPPGLHWGRRDC